MKTFEGSVVTKSGDKTITVEVVSIKVHPRYGKRYRVRRRFLVHDEANAKQVGDRVSFVASRPISKRKQFTLVR